MTEALECFTIWYTYYKNSKAWNKNVNDLDGTLEDIRCPADVSPLFVDICFKPLNTNTSR